MKILILTPINPIFSTQLTSQIYKKFGERKDLDIIPYSYIAEMKCMTQPDVEFVPAFFSVLKAAQHKKTQKKLYTKKHSITIGTTYKTEKFDSVVAFTGETGIEVGLPFDSYIELIKTDPELKDFKELADIDNLYTRYDAEFDLQTVRHVLLYLEGALK